MEGNIYIINGSYGFINGDDNNEYYFNKNGLINCTIYQLSEGDRVGFDITVQPDQKRDMAINIRKKDKINNEERAVVTPGIHPSFKFDNFNDDEIKIINNLKTVLYLTNGGDPISLYNSLFRYILTKPTETFALTFNLSREIVVVFADYVSFEPRSLDVAQQVCKQYPKLRLDRSIQILISSDINIEKKLAALFKDTNLDSIVIPFSYKELLTNATESFILNRFRKYLFDIDLFSSVKPIENDLFFFGRRDFAFDIANKCKNNIHSGIFGLRRSGKTSLLYAIKRLLSNDNYPTIYIPCQSKLSKSSWQIALYEIIKDVCAETGYHQCNLHSKKSYMEDNAAVVFEEDFTLLFQNTQKPIVLMFDEIEAITFDVPGNHEQWLNGEGFTSLWNAIRGYYSKYPHNMSVVIAGTNPMINEIPVIQNDITNPMYGQLSKANQGAYLLPFTFIDTKNMVNTLGGYMGLKFDDDVCLALTKDCGGHPYLIRLLCSFINRQLKSQNVTRPKTIKLQSYSKHLSQFEESTDATGFYLMILNILVTSYPKEFNVLKEIALNGDEYVSKFVDDRALMHLLGYGLIDKDDERYNIKFETISRYLLGKYKYERLNLTIEEQKAEISYRLNTAEMSLRNLIRTTLQITKGDDDAKNIVIQAMQKHNAINSNDVNKAKSMSLSQIFDPSINKLYFSLLSEIIINNYPLFSNVFIGESINTINNHFTVLNRARRVPDHSYTQNAEGWGIEDFKQYRKSIAWLESILKKYQ